jgi:hypothetical protein
MKTVSCPQPSSDLCEKIIMRIHKEERILVIKSLVLFSFITVVSAVALVPIAQTLLSQLESSGFLQFSSLMFSDFSLVLVYWKSFAMIILETLPALSIALLLAFLLTLLQSTISLAKNIRLIIKTSNNGRHLSVKTI